MNTQPQIIALTGHTGAGKDTAADYLQANGFARIAFADAIRREVSEAWRIDMRLLINRHTKEIPLPSMAVGMSQCVGFIRFMAHSEESLTEPRSPRWVMQQWGSFQQRFDQRRYVSIVEKWIGRQIGTGWSKMVITDVRTRAEAQMLRSMGAQVIRITRPETQPLQGAEGHHVTESGERSIEADHLILNDGSLAALFEQVAHIAGGACIEG